MYRSLVNLVILSFLLTIFITSTLGATDEALEEMIQKIETAHGTIKDFQAEFHQVTHYEGFETEIDSKGRVYFKKPGRLRWEYLSPNQNQVIVKNNKMWIFTPELKQVITTPFSEFSDSNIPFHLLSDFGHMNRDFEITWTAPQGEKSPTGENGPLKLTLKPVEPGTGLKKIELEVDPNQYFIRHIVLYEINGNLSSFTFSRIKTNVGLKEKLFTFTVPKGVEVIENPLRK